MYKNIVTQTLRKPLFKTKGISVDVLRLDLMHPVISGNKWFKLKYHLAEAIEQKKKGFITFGGAYSNHLVATACASHENNLESIGIIRGEEPSIPNMSIRQMKHFGMQLMYVSREDYRKKDALIEKFSKDYYLVPEGGQSLQGVHGASEILDLTTDNYTHVVCPVGTGTTLAGLVQSARDNQQVIGISALKIASVNNEIEHFIQSIAGEKTFTIIYDYHFGGYAKKTDELIAFMNALYNEENIPTDFVYTGKTFFAVHELAGDDFFSSGSRVLIIHTGGLQGNLSLPKGTLVF
jgi:1-aminocyclopropane-1-carboxylate deaminase/D-cysteine desulfhydrase-like pyridoxal-dependent ACC family enzyme